LDEKTDFYKRGEGGILKKYVADELFTEKA